MVTYCSTETVKTEKRQQKTKEKKTELNFKYFVIDKFGVFLE